VELLRRDDLFTLEVYAEQREGFRQRVMAHKRHRRLPLGAHMTLYFEDRLTMQYQIQEMLRIERIFEPDAIEQELAAYNPLIPDGDNWKATLMIEYSDADERSVALRQLIGIEQRVWLQVGELPPLFPIADEDIERSNGEKSSAVHFLRFQLIPVMVDALKGGAGLSAGVDHKNYIVETTPVAATIRSALLADLD